MGSGLKKVSKLASLVGVAAAALVLAGCTSGPFSAEGTWGTGAEGKPQLVLEPGGELTGTDGCNQLMGTWAQEEDETIVFSGVASTQMFCMGVNTWLSQLDTAVIDGGYLRVSNADGSDIGILVRQ